MSPRVDERALAAGTTARFVLLVVLLVVSSGLMVLYVAIALSTYDGFGCSLAAGVDPARDDAATMIAKRALQWESYYACTVRYAAAPPWWVPVGWLVLLAVLTTALFWLLPRWKSRRVVPLTAVDEDGELQVLLDELTRTAGVARAPRFVVDPTAASTGAVVFGRTRRPTVCLHGGLLVRRHTDPAGFRAVLLHELAHIRNGDITITYLTVALWRVYLAVALPPFLAWCGFMFARASKSAMWSSEAPIVTRGLLLTVVMVVLVYLARSDVLRNREIYADLAAVRWGADPRGWAAHTSSRGGRLRAVVDPHPGWDQRREALTDPEVLFGLRPLPIVLTGAAAAMVSTHVSYALTQYVLLSHWAQYAAATAAAALVTGVVGVALWRAVVHAVLTGRRVPSGARAGVWLGLGLTFGGVVTGQGTINEWLPGRPLVLVLVVLTAIVFTWWTTRCALLWVSAWPGRTLRPVLLLSLVAGTLALSLWFGWWQNQGVAFTAGWSFDIAGVRDVLVANLTGRAAETAPVTWVDSVLAVTMTVLSGVTAAPPALVAVAALWVVPLLAWLVRPKGRAPRWARAAVADLAEDQRLGSPLPRLRRVLLPGLVGGLVGCVAIAGTAAYLRFRMPSETSVTGFMARFFALTIFALVLGAAVAAAVASLSVRGHRLIAAVIAAQVATLLGFAGLYLREGFDGCVPTITLVNGPCGWRPLSVTRLATTFLAPALVLGVVVAVAVAATVALASRRRSSPSGPSEVRRMAARRLSVVALCVLALGFGTMRTVELSAQATRMPAPSDVQRLAKQWAKPAGAGTPSARSMALQVEAWADRGGDALMNRFYRDVRIAFATVTTHVQSGKHGLAELASVRPLCTDIVDFARTGARFFQIPDAQTHQLWKKFLVQAFKAAQACVKALDDQAIEPFNASMRALAAARETGDQLDDRIDALIDAGR